MKIQLSNWSAHLHLIDTGTSFTVPEGLKWCVTGISVVPHESYIPPAPSDTWALRGDYGCIRLVIDSINEEETPQFSANAMLLMDRHQQIRQQLPTNADHLALSKTVHASARALDFVARHINTLKTAVEDTTALEAALIAARGAWQRYREAVSRTDLDLPVLINGGQTLRIERRESVLGGLGHLIPEALTIELSVFERSVPQDVEVRRDYLEIDDQRVRMVRSSAEALRTEANRTDITPEKRLVRINKILDAMAYNIDALELKAVPDAD